MAAADHLLELRHFMTVTVRTDPVAQVTAGRLADELLDGEPTHISVFVRLTVADLFAFAADRQQ